MPKKEKNSVENETVETINVAEEAPAEEPMDTESVSSASEIEALTEKLEKQKDLFLRTAAEYDNFRKRTKRERETFFADAKAVTLAALLPVFDSLDRAIDVTDTNIEDYRSGIEMVVTQLGEILTQLGVEEIGHVGDPFDPEKHNAVSREEHVDNKDNTIAQVLQKGYSVDGKILRHAIVSVYN